LDLREVAAPNAVTAPPIVGSSFVRNGPIRTTSRPLTVIVC
jgi:hypothetical protein